MKQGHWLIVITKIKTGVQIRRKERKKQIKFLLELQSYFLIKRSFFHLCSTSRYIVNYSQEFILMQGKLETTTSPRRNGYWMVIRFPMVLQQIFARHWTMIFPKKEILNIMDLAWMKQFIIWRYLFPGCGRFMFFVKEIPEQQPCSLLNI